jgi:hypothetical protein
MAQSMLFLHWKQVRMPLVPFVIAAFGLPLMTVQGLGTPPGMAATSLEAYRFVDSVGAWLPFFPLLAAAVGITLALSAWNWDHQLNHVYALSLPLTRTEYALHKMAAGAVLALVPAAGMWLGAHVAAASIVLPSGLHAYPNALAIRFLMATLLTYAVFFALASGTIKTTLWVVTAIVSFFVVGTLGSELLAPYVRVFASTNIVQEVVTWVTHAPGPFEVFTGSWSLIDV